MSNNHDELIRQFSDVTGADAHRARFFLESSAWEVDLAIYRYFENDGANEENSANQGLVSAAEPVAASDSDPELFNDEDEDVPPRPPKKDKSKKNTNTRFATLQSLNQPSSSDEEEGEAFYAGGSERSGQQIIGPGKNKDDIVSNMFKSVKKHGAMVVEPDPSAASSSSSFAGVGYRLGATPDDTTVVNTTKPKSKRGGDSDIENVVLRLWKNGFSLDDGELRPYTDPANSEFLECVRRGEIPRELRRGAEVHLTMEDHRHEDFSRGPAKPFHGKGHLLGSPAPTTIGSTSPQLSSPMDQEANQKAAQSALNINEEEPTTNIQIRLADGSRLNGRFNLSHTISNLREYIVTAVPSYQLETFILQTTFPNKELTEMGQTISEAGLLNAVVVQRLK